MICPAQDINDSAMKAATRNIKLNAVKFSFFCPWELVNGKIFFKNTGGSRSKVQEGAAYKVQEGSLYKVQSPFFREISQEVVAYKVQSDFFLILFSNF